MNGEPLQAPFPYFGGKSRIAPQVWERFGDVRNYVEPFMGSLAMLLGRPESFTGTETVNDACGFLSNFWRAVQADPEKVAHYASWPVVENDLHARHAWLTVHRDDITRRLEGDPDWFDSKIAGWWVWGACCWIGHGWCSGNGPWRVVDDGDGPKLLKTGGDAGMGVNRQRVSLVEWFGGLSARLRRVRVCCGDWSRVCGSSVLRGGTGGKYEKAEFLTAVFLDPPYADTAGRASNLYGATESLSVAHDVRRWAIEHGDDPRLRIALCGYEGEHTMPASWDCLAWKTGGGYRNGVGKHVNSHRERVWFSPHCLARHDVSEVFSLTCS